MKKLIMIVLALMLVLSLVACGGNSKKGNDNNSPSDSENSNNSTNDSGGNISDSDNNANSTSTPVVSAINDSKIFVDLEEVRTDTPPHTVDGITMVPVQAIIEKIGYDVNWVKEDQKLEVWEPSKQHPAIIITIGDTTAYYEKYATEIDERVSYEAILDVAPIMIDETMFAPLSFISEAVGYTVDNKVDSTDIYLFSPYYMENQVGEGIGETVLLPIY